MAQTLVLDIDYNITKAEAKTRTLEAQWEKQKVKVDEQAAKVAELKAQLDQIAEARALDNQLVQSGAISQQEYTESAEVLNIKEKEISGEYSRQNTELNLQNGKLGEIQAKMNGVADSTKGATKGASGFEKSLSSINKRIFGLMKRIFFFSVITKMFRKLKESFKNLVGQDKEMSKDLAQIKGNMAVIGQTLFQTIAPALRTILSFVNKLTQAIAVLLSSALGKDINQMKKLAKESKKVAENTEEAAKSTASFDTINIADDGKKDSGNEESGGADFSGIDQAQATLDDLAKIAMASGAVLLGIGILLITFGQLVPGIVMMAAGAGLLFGGARIGDSALDSKTKKLLTIIGTVAGVALLAIGIILVCLCKNPKALALGISMIVAGAISLFSVIALNGNAIKEFVKKNISAILGIVGGALLAIGIILVCCGNLAVGIPMIIAGAASLISDIVINREAILNWIKGILNAIGTFFKKLWKGIVDGAKATWEGIKAVFSAIGDFFVDFWEGIKVVFYSIGEFFVDLWEGIKITFSAIGEFFVGIWEGIKAGFVAIGEFFVSLWDGIKAGFEAIGEFFVDVWDGIKTGFSAVGDFFVGMWEGVKNGAKNAWDGIKNIFSSVGTFFKDIFSKAWEGVINVFSSGGKIFLNIGNSIVDAFKIVVNAIIDGINTVVTVPFDGINWALKKIKGISIVGAKPFGWIKTIPVPKIPHLAEGGVIPGGREFMAVLGDQPAGQTNIEAPLETIKQALAEVLGGYNPQFNVKATGSMSQLIAMLNLKIEQEKNRASIWG